MKKHRPGGVLPGRGVHRFDSTDLDCLLNPRDKRLKACWIITEIVVVN